MGRKRKNDTHLDVHVYVKHGRFKDTYYTLIGGKYHGLGNERVTAERKARDLAAGKATPGSIQDLCERFIEHLREMLRTGDTAALAERTVDDYEAGFKDHIFPVFGHMPAREFKPSHKGEYLDRMRKAGRPVRANREMAGLGSAFNYGMRIGIVDSNPCHGVRRNTERPRTRRPEIREVNAFLQTAKAKGKQSYVVSLIGVMVGVTGRRRAEVRCLPLAALRAEGVVVQAAKIKPDEPDREYVITWSPFLRELMQEAKSLARPEGSEFVFSNRAGQPYTESGFKAMWAKIMSDYVRQGGVRFTAHDLRAMYVTEMVEREKKPETHRNEATTRRIYDRRRRVKVTPLA